MVHIIKVIEDKKDSYGILKYINKDIYEGYWENDTKSRKVFMIYNEGKINCI